MRVRDLDRRSFLHGLAASGLAAFTTPGVFAQQLVETGTTTEGPFYPDVLPLDIDNDLLIINDGITPAVGEITHLTGRVVTKTGQPVRNAFVEIWQVDHTGSYVHTGGRQPAGVDRNFQGYGRFLSDVKGQYYFRTIKPIEYTLIGIFRTAHIHVAVSQNGRRVFTSQLLVNGHPANARDTIVRSLEPRALKTLLVDFKPLPGTSSASCRRTSTSCSARRRTSSRSGRYAESPLRIAGDRPVVSRQPSAIDPGWSRDCLRPGR